MQAFTQLTSKAAPLDAPNVDTDQIIPKQFLKRVERTGFGRFLFYDWRFKDDQSEDPDFSLNKPEHKGAQILVARDNFGCGSSREHAPWALLDYGFRVIIAPSYADIFYNNCFQNGILPVVLNASEVQRVFEAIEADPQVKIDVNLEEQKVSVENGETFTFDIRENLKEKLLKGLDDIGWTLQFEKEITEYEKAHSI